MWVCADATPLFHSRLFRSRSQGQLENNCEEDHQNELYSSDLRIRNHSSIRFLNGHHCFFQQCVDNCFCQMVYFHYRICKINSIFRQFGWPKQIPISVITYWVFVRSFWRGLYRKVSAGLSQFVIISHLEIRQIEISNLLQNVGCKSIICSNHLISVA